MLRWRVRERVIVCALALPPLACGRTSSAGPKAGPVASEAGETSIGYTGPEQGGADATDTSGTGGRASGGVGGEPGGQVAPAGGGGSVPSGGGDTATDPGEACVEEACQLSVTPAPLWVTKLAGYGRGPAFMDFSDAAKVVRVGAGENDYYVSTLDLATGEVVEQPTKTAWVIAADQSGRRTVRALEQCTVSVDGTETFRFNCSPRGAVRFSADGSVIGYQACVSDSGGVRLEAYDTDGGQLIASATADLPCFYGDLNVLVDAERRRTLFAHPNRSELFIFDWDSQTIDTRAIHAAAPVSNHAPFNREGTILTISLSPDAQHLVSVGAADGLAWLEPKDLTVQLRIPDVPFFNLYDDCYTTYLDESPVAWSPAGQVFASARPGGGIVLREVATKKQLALLDPPTDPNVIRPASSCSSEFGPVLMEFSPDMRRLGVLYPGHATVYALSAP